MKSIVISFILMIFCTAVILAQSGTVNNFQKISDTQGNFTGILNSDDEFGEPAYIGDLNGDGISDIAVGSRYDNDGGTDRGAVYILFMNSNGTVNSYQKISDTQGNFNDPLADNSYFGWTVTGIGDLNGDGHPDIAVSSFNVSMVWIIFLNANGTVQSYQKIGDGLGGFPAGVISSGDFFGISVRSIGDFNNDGKQEIAVGAEKTNDGGTAHGAFYIFNLTSSGTVQSYHKISQTSGNFTATLTTDCRFGRTIVPIGDLNSDGVTDLAVSAIFDNDGGTHRGAFYILFMNQNYTVNSWQKISDTQGNFTGVLDDNDQFGIGLSGIGDLNGDGTPDIAVGANQDDDGGENRGAVWILFLNTYGTVNSFQKISNTTGNFNAVLDNDDYFGGIISFLGDFNNDGHPEIVVGAPYDDDGGYNHGAVYIISLNTYCNFDLDLGNNITICQGQNITLNATVPGGSYIWSNGSTSSNIQVNSEGTYAVTVTNQCKSVSDSIDIDVSLLPIIGFAGDTNIYQGQSAILDAGYCNCTYHWSTGANSQTLTITDQGTYSVTVTNNNNCTASGSINVTVSIAPPDSPGWTITNTGANHTILIPENIPITFNGIQIEPGDYIGVFYSLNGVPTCGGYIEWTGISVAITAWGADPAAGGNNGFTSGENFIWKIWDASANTECYAEAAYNTINFPNAGNYVTNGMSGLNSLTSYQSFPSWNYTITNNNHTILITSSIPMIVNGSPVQPGDFIGVFYDSSGTLACGGYIKWMGVTTSIAAWGSDPTMGNYSGFSTNETFKWKIWKISTNIEYSAFATYNTIICPNAGEYVGNGLSGISSLSGFNSEGQAISLPSGWSIFSTYISPVSPVISDVFSGVSSMLITKDDNGNVYWPQYNINLIGNLSIGKGYLIKMNQSYSLYITGLAVHPENTPINVPFGWSIIGYLRQSSASIVSIFSSTVSSVNLVKNGNGQVYWPLYNVNLIDNMNPGEGYQINTNAALTLTYPQN
ncbi:MAG: VCBS repeat-containing protein [Bacteroidia bacterium]|nr:VCBS repeat-containing protein [Bacteroidia bacterium]